MRRVLLLVLSAGCAEPPPPAPPDAALPKDAAAEADAEVVPALAPAPPAAVKLGYYVTTYRFKGSYANRAHNIEHIADEFRSGPWSMLPGEERCFNEHVGPRSKDNDFLPAPGIFMGEVMDDVGGGTCQASSTIFAAALASGLDVIERTAHSRPSKYIGKGLDATVSYPEGCDGGACAKLDLCIRNPYPFTVTMTTEIGQGAGDEIEHALTVAFYGEGPPPRVEMRWLGGKQDASWEKRFHKTGKIRTATYKKRVQEGAAGLAGVLQVTRVWQDGRIDMQKFSSNYKPVDEVWEVGLDWDMTKKPWEPAEVK